MVHPHRLLTIAAALALAACDSFPSLTPARAPTPTTTTAAVSVPGTAPAAASASPAVSSPPLAATNRCAPGEQAMVNDTLYFGTSIPKSKSDSGASTVSANAWQGFMDSVVTPRFPQGIAIWRAAGQWRGDNGAVVREASYVLQLVYPSDAATDVAVTEVMTRYKTQFRQEAVLRVRTPACVSF